MSTYKQNKSLILILLLYLSYAFDMDNTEAIEEFRRYMLDAHNEWRIAYGLPLYNRENYLEVSSNEWVKHMWDIKTMIHSHNPMVGENLAWRSENITDLKTLTYALYKQWSDEIFHFSNNKVPYTSTDGYPTGHISQILWKTSTKLGCSMYGKDTTYYVVCHYSPVGNIFGMTPF